MLTDRSATAVVLAIFALLVASLLGFAFVDASALQSETSIDSSVGTSRVNDASASLDGPVTVYVASDGWLEQRMTDRIVDELDDRGATVTRVESLDEAGEDPILAVRVTDSAVSYSPFSPSATVATSFAYVHSGNATLVRSVIEGDSIVLSNRDAYVVSGDVTVRDESRGVATWPAYKRTVSTATAEAVLKALSDAPGMDQPD